VEQLEETQFDSLLGCHFEKMTQMVPQVLGIVRAAGILFENTSQGIYVGIDIKICRCEKNSALKAWQETQTVVTVATLVSGCYFSTFVVIFAVVVLPALHPCVLASWRCHCSLLSIGNWKSFLPSA